MGNLTAKAVQAAKSGAKDVYLRDGEGLELRVTPKGAKIWQLRYQLDKKRRVISLGSAAHVTLKEARSKADGCHKLIDSGIDPVEHQRQQEIEREEAERQARIEREARRTFGDLLEHWAELELLQRKTGAESMRALRKDALPALAEREIATVTRADVLECVDRIMKRGSTRMATRTLSDVKQFLTWCELREYIERNPLDGISKTAVTGKAIERDRIMEDGEILELRDKLPEAGFTRATGLALWISLATACRIGEVIAARWEHVDLDAGTWRLPETKNNRAHRVYLSDFARRQFAELRELTAWSDWVLPATRKADTHVCPKSITRQVRDRQRDQPLRNRSSATASLVLSGGTWTPHDLRRSCASGMARLGILPDVIERCLNHIEQNRVKRIYQRHDYANEQAEAWRRWGDHLDRLLSGKEAKVIPLRRA